MLKAYQKTSGEYSQAERDAIEQFTTADVEASRHDRLPDSPVYAVGFSPDGRRLAAGTASGIVLVHDVEPDGSNSSSPPRR